ncbi:DUF3291 domain-containing protein [Streptomyces sp. TS71-3]|uniref:DUF3291 domain-containing protein n=1 Tax=Streptomyces sp. TS71-3 TaxID=2733862 RepID=UPI001B0E618C|nr:DUF3291 domain-containing protein [Streptomyces sp. TS71-3]GHJ35938.1 hypothetical protein Sm713_15470 [Streptomyces sp. TS71-3]
MSSFDSNATEPTPTAGEFELAQVNIARLRAPLDSPVPEDFAAAVGPVNEVADGSDGFVRRLRSDSGDATDVPVFDDSWLIHAFTLRSAFPPSAAPGTSAPAPSAPAPAVSAPSAAEPSAPAASADLGQGD